MESKITKTVNNADKGDIQMEINKPMRKTVMERDYKKYEEIMSSAMEEHFHRAQVDAEHALQRKFLAYYFNEVTDEGTWDGWATPTVKRNETTEWRYNLQYYPEGIYEDGACVAIVDIYVAKIGREYVLPPRCPEDEVPAAIEALVNEIQRCYPVYDKNVEQSIADSIFEFDQRYFDTHPNDADEVA